MYIAHMFTSCHLCRNKVLIDGNCLLEHVALEHVKMGSQKCFACDFTCETLEEGTAHIGKKHTPMTAYLEDISEVVEMKTRKMLKKCFPSHHQLCYLPPTFVKCQDCGAKVRNNWRNIESHAQYHVDMSPTNCKICMQYFSNGRNLEDHMWLFHPDCSTKKTDSDHLILIGMVEKCFPGTSGPASPVSKPILTTPHRPRRSDRMKRLRKQLF